MKSDAKFFNKAFTNSPYSNCLVRINMQNGNKDKINMLKATIKKIVILDRNPPSPYSIERVQIFFV